MTGEFLCLGKNENDERRESRCIQRRQMDCGGGSLRDPSLRVGCDDILCARERLGASRGADFSPDSIQLVGASGKGAVVWTIAERKRVRNLEHGSWVKAVKYSPQGERIATATFCSESVI